MQKMHAKCCPAQGENPYQYGGINSEFYDRYGGTRYQRAKFTLKPKTQRVLSVFMLFRKVVAFLIA